MTKRINLGKYVLVTSLVFVFAFLSGYSTSIRFPKESAELVEGFFGSLKFTVEMSDFSIFLFILLNNSIKAFLIILLGFFFSIVPLIFIYTNGELIGLVFGVFAREHGFGKIMWSVLPHGVLEIPAIILAGSYGIWLGVCFFRKIAYRDPFGEKFFFAMKKYFKIILPMILAAAVIEGFLTPVILEIIFSDK